MLYLREFYVSAKMKFKHSFSLIQCLKFVYFLVFFLPSLVGFGQVNVPISGLRFLSEYTIAHNITFQNTIIGGLSGIDYNSSDSLFYLLSDDRSVYNDARFYTARIKFLNQQIDTIEFLSLQSLLQKNGLPFPSSRVSAKNATDPEAMRYNTKTSQIVWSSEGERIVIGGEKVLTNPSITTSTEKGDYISSWRIPSNLFMQVNLKGPRKNGSLEGLTFENDFSTLLVAMEEPLYEDGANAEFGVSASWVRFFRFDPASRKCTEQYAYPLDPVAYPAIPPTSFKVNGISEILSFGKNRVLVVERSFSTGRISCTVKLFLADLTDAENISKTYSLERHLPAPAISKSLLLNMDNLGIHIDNVEGVTFGPTLPNGHKTLIFVTDNNFLPTQKTQFLLFEILP